MDVIQRELLNIIQTDFPIVDRPYHELGSQVGIGEGEAYAKISLLRDKGIIRRLGGVFDSRRLGYHSTLCAAKVPQAKMALLTERLTEMPGVTHNYLRNHAYNMWFTLIAPTPLAVEEALSSLRKFSGVKDIYSLPALNIFKIKVDLDLNAGGEEGDEDQSFSMVNRNEDNSVSREEPYTVTQEEITLIKILQDDLPDGLTPYQEIAHRLHWNPDKVIQTTRNLVEHKVIRRFGAVLRHQKAGFVANVMGVWKVEPERVVEAGTLMAQFKEVSHCYERPTLPDWPYNLFTMVHGRSAEDCQRIMNQISQTVNINNFNMLYSLKELKKSSMQYFLEEQG